MVTKTKKLKKESLISLILVAFACVLSFALHVPAFDFPLDFDVGGHYFYGMQIINQGFYSVLWEMKPAGLLLIFASIYKFLGAFQIWIHIVGSFVWMASTFFFYKLTKLLFNIHVGVLAALIFALFSSSRAIQGEMINTETFLMFPTLIGIYLFFKARGKKDWRFFVLSGIFLGIAFTIKQVVIFDMLALLFYSLFFLCKDYKKNLKLFLKSNLILGLSFLIPISFFAIYFLFTNRFAYFLYWQFLKTFRNMSTLHVYGTAFRHFFRNFGPIYKHTYPIWLLGLGGTISSLLFLPSIKRIFLLIWFFCVFLGIYFMWFFFPHHFLQFVPSLSILAGLFLFDLLSLRFNKRNNRWLVIKNAAVYFALFSSAVSLLKADSPYFVSYFQKLGGKINRKEHLAAVGFDIGPDGWLPFYETADYLKKETGSQETIFLWGTVPTIYALAEKQPISWFVYKDPLIFDELRSLTYQGWFSNVEENRKQLVEELSHKLPDYIIIQVEIEKIFDEMISFKAFSQFVHQNYQFDTQIGRILIFKKRSEISKLEEFKNNYQTIPLDIIKRYAAITQLKTQKEETEITFEPMVNPGGVLRSFKAVYPGTIEIDFEPITLEFFGKDGYDSVGVGSYQPSGVIDLHLRIRGVKKPISFVRVKIGKTTWNNRAYGVNPVLRIMQTEAGTLDLFFEPPKGWQGKTCNVYFIYKDGSISSQDITLPHSKVSVRALQE